MNEQAENYESVKRTSPPQAVAKNAGEFVHDVVTLAELQAALFKEEMSTGLFRLLRVVGVFVIAFAIAVSCLPIALIAVAYLFHAYGWSLAASFAWSTAIGLLVALACGGTGWMLFSRSKPVLMRSKRELQQNVSWLKQVLVRSRAAASTP